MCERRLGTAVAFIAVVMCPLLLECTTTKCQIGNPNDDVGVCPVKLTSVRSQASGRMYSECVSVRVWMKAEDILNGPRIKILSTNDEKIKLTLKTDKKKGETRVVCEGSGTQQGPHTNTSSAVWELVHDCVKAHVNHVVSVSYKTNTSCKVTYTVKDPKPDFLLSVDHPSKSITVIVEPGVVEPVDKVHVRWCYLNSGGNCMDGGPQITIDPSQSRSALLNIPSLLPCVCVQAYYTHTDALRRKECPFRNQSLAGHSMGYIHQSNELAKHKDWKQREADSIPLSKDLVDDVWLFSKVVLLRDSSVVWKSVCPARDLQISASLCWKQHEHLCTPVLNSTLEGKEIGSNLKYNTSAVDKHPQMCVQFSLQGRHNISCPFETDMSSWEVYIGTGRQSVFLYLTSLKENFAGTKFVPAKFSAQLCVLNEAGCTPVGQVRSATVEGNTSEITINVPRHFFSEKLCVQVWQSDPSLLGRRILCPDYTHKRLGLFAVAALVFVVIVGTLGTLIYRLTKSLAAGWLYIQKPVLVVCSSDLSAHVSAVCALASILKGELSSTVHMALWAQCSQTQAEAGSGTGVGDLGPVPWLYGQWEAVRKAQGKVLIVWSPEAKKIYEKWSEKRANMGNKNGRKEEDHSTAEVKLNGKRLGKCKKQKACVKLCDDIDSQKEPSAVIAPVFMAALACLEGALQGCKGQGVALVYFQGLCHSRDIPKALRGAPRYCLPQDFRGLIQELGGMSTRTQTGKFRWHCWPRLLSKVMSVWLARQLAQRLETLLPQAKAKRTQGPSVTSSSGKRRARFKLPPAAGTARPESVEEKQPLRPSPWRAEKLSSPVSRV